MGASCSYTVVTMWIRGKIRVYGRMAFLDVKWSVMRCDVEYEFEERYKRKEPVVRGNRQEYLSKT